MQKKCKYTYLRRMVRLLSVFDSNVLFWFASWMNAAKRWIDESTLLTIRQIKNTPRNWYLILYYRLNGDPNQINTHEAIEMTDIKKAVDKAYGLKRSASGSSVVEATKRCGSVKQNQNDEAENGEYFQKRKEKSAKILIVIVLTFLLCHSLKISIKVYEVLYPSHSTSEHANFCLQEQER